MIAEKLIVMRLHFDPKEDVDTDRVFNDDVARTLYLLWRRGHIVDQSFVSQVSAVASKWNVAKPMSVREASLLFPHVMNFPEKDVVKFLEEHWEFFTVERTVTYEVVRGNINDELSHIVSRVEEETDD